MTLTFTERLCVAIRSCDGGDVATRHLIGRAIADTVSVAAAGFAEPAARLALDTYRGRGARTWSGEECESEEAAVMVDGIAAHALDFDDVLLESAIHPSAVILPAILRSGLDHEYPDVIAAFAAGLVAAQAIAARIGLGHYHKGWHGTGTIGAFAAAAAAGRLHRLDERQLSATLAIVASQSAGLRLNFGTMTKPAHAGFAAAAGYRAVRLAQAGFSAAEDIFGPRGYGELYGAGDGIEEPAADTYVPRPDKIALKLYPCCYATHRLIGIALDARPTIQDLLRDSATDIRVTVPKGSTEVLIHDRPRTGLEAKFSGPYAIATALLDGPPTLEHFEDQAVGRRGIGEFMQRIAIVEDPEQDSGGDIESGIVVLEAIDKAGNTLGKFSRRSIPGSPGAQPSLHDLHAKIESCSDVFARAMGFPFPALRQCAAIPETHRWLPQRNSE